MFIARALLLALFGSFGPFSVGLGAFILMAVYYPSGVRAVQRWAQNVENMFDFDSLPDAAAILVNLVIDDNSITMLVFVVSAKFAFSLIGELVSRSKKPTPPKEIS